MKPPVGWLPSPNTVSSSMPWVMYIIAPASATTLSRGVEVDFDELQVLAHDAEVDLVAPGGPESAAAEARRRPWRRCRDSPASAGTSFRGVQADMPGAKTSVEPSTLPFLILATTSSSETGPTWCPPIAMYHCWPGIDSILRD